MDHSFGVTFPPQTLTFFLFACIKLNYSSWGYSPWPENYLRSLICFDFFTLTVWKNLRGLSVWFWLKTRQWGSPFPSTSPLGLSSHFLSSSVHDIPHLFSLLPSYFSLHPLTKRHILFVYDMIFRVKFFILHDGGVCRKIRMTKPDWQVVPSGYSCRFPNWPPPQRNPSLLETAYIWTMTDLRCVNRMSALKRFNTTWDWMIRPPSTS